MTKKAFPGIPHAKGGLSWAHFHADARVCNLPCTPCGEKSMGNFLLIQNKSLESCEPKST
jgi:hypothetical protein